MKKTETPRFLSFERRMRSLFVFCVIKGVINPRRPAPRPAPRLATFLLPVYDKR